MGSNFSNSKSDFYTSAKGYRDMDGQSRNFDFIDYSPKTKISTNVNNTEDISKALTDSRKAIIEKILSRPASFCPLQFVDFTLRGEAFDSIQWNNEMLSDEGVPITRLLDLSAILANRVNATKTY